MRTRRTPQRTRTFRFANSAVKEFACRDLSQSLWKDVMRMARKIVVGFVLLSVAASQEVKRPPITGLSHVAFYSTSTADAKRFYVDLLGLEPGSRDGVYLVGQQSIEAEAETPANPPSLLAHIAFATPDAERMRRYLQSRGVPVTAEVRKEPNGTRWFAMRDPEGHVIEFVQEKMPWKAQPRALSSQIIHAGFVVRDRAATDKFYRDILSFKLYWSGGMEEGHTDWVAMQVPEGRQWIEYMMTEKDAQPSAQLLGVLNHVSLGVPDIQAAAKRLRERGWSPKEERDPQMGKDGKWQLNVYDPDGTRVEFMEFKPVEKPCCAPFTGPHPEELKR
jgi:catechol 2,3-dioxygenase-like lactoylglutathione lyase family enzyme